MPARYGARLERELKLPEKHWVQHLINWVLAAPFWMALLLLVFVISAIKG